MSTSIFKELILILSVFHIFNGYMHKGIGTDSIPFKHSGGLEVEYSYCLKNISTLH